MGGLAVNTSDTLAYLGELRVELADLPTEIGTRGDAAFLKLWSSTESERWAVVSSPGDRWFSLEVNGGFSLDYFEEETEESDARSLIRRNVALAQEYVRGDTQPTDRPWRPSVLSLNLADDEYQLHRSLSYEIKRLIGLRRPRHDEGQS